MLTSFDTALNQYRLATTQAEHILADSGLCEHAAFKVGEDA